MPYLKQVCNDDGSCASYVLGCATAGECAVVDPREDVSRYVEIAKENATKITRIIETHIHADHFSGARKLAEETGATIHLHESARVKYGFDPLKDKQMLEMANLRIKVMFTPGHTPESISLLYIDKTRSEASAWSVLTGDTLFVGDVGRLDLTGAGTPAQMYDSIRKLLSLEDYVEVYPAHYAGSVCGKGMSPKTVSTIGFERRFNQALRLPSLHEFEQYLKANAPEPFPQHERIKAENAGFFETASRR